MRRLYHYTCEHQAPQIADDGELIPNPMVQPSLVWMTDLTVPIRHGLGLTSELLECDRTRFRFTVADDARDLFVWWPRWRRAHREHLPIAHDLEEAAGARPAHWWVSESPVRVLVPGLDRYA